jgi:very-short-patch-repair endonuclease
MGKQHHVVALTGPSAAALHELDGFRERLWPHRYTAHHNSRTSENVIRTRAAFEPHFFGATPVAPIWLVLRHLNAVPEDLLRCDDEVSPRDRVELATEHARRDGLVVQTSLGGNDTGNAMLREVRRLSGHEPPTESYAETRALQQFREWAVVPWRQMPLAIGRQNYRADFVIPFRRIVRPDLFRPIHGLIVEIDSKEWHETKFEEDHARWNAFDRAGYHWVSITPNFLDRNPAKVLAQIEGVFRKAGVLLSHPTRSSGAPNRFRKAG